MVTRVQWTMDDFKEIYARYKESGLTIKDFCSNEGIKRKRFSFWKAKLKGPKTNAAAKGSLYRLKWELAVMPCPAKLQLQHLFFLLIFLLPDSHKVSVK